MKITIKLNKRISTGEMKVITIEGTTDAVSTDDMKILWDAEHAINQHTHVRCHLSVHEK